MVKINMKGFRPVELKWGGLTIQRGGHLNKALPVISKDVRPHGCGPEIPPSTFVHIRSREPWLNQAVMGTVSRGDMETGVLAELRGKVNSEEQRVRELGTSDPIYDPMDEMMGLDEICETPAPKKDRRKQKKPFIPQIVLINMPEWPQQAMQGSAQAVRKVALYIEGTQKLWINSEDLEWLIRSLFIYQQLKGVDHVASDDEGPDAPQSLSLIHI